jgi:hypothetical protein
MREMRDITVIGTFRMTKRKYFSDGALWNGSQTVTECCDSLKDLGFDFLCTAIRHDTAISWRTPSGIARDGLSLCSKRWGKDGRAGHDEISKLGLGHREKETGPL